MEVSSTSGRIGRIGRIGGIGGIGGIGEIAGSDHAHGSSGTICAHHRLYNYDCQIS